MGISAGLRGVEVEGKTIHPLGLARELDAGKIENVIDKTFV